MKKQNQIAIERIQTGVRLEKRILKVLKASAEMAEISLGQMIEVLALHAFHGEHSFSPPTRKKITQLMQVYGLDYDIHDYKKFIEDDLGCGSKGCD